MDAMAVIFDKPETLRLGRLPLPALKSGEILVEVDFSGISTGTERLLWQGTMPPFPGMGYPLIPGYETVGRIIAKSDDVSLEEGARVFVPGANCFEGVRGLFGGAASKLVVAAARVVPVSVDDGQEAVLLALAGTAYHALINGPLPELIVGHGVLGRLMARLVPLLGGVSPVVWDNDPSRRRHADGYTVTCAEEDDRRDYAAIADVSGDSNILDSAVQRLAKGGEITLAGFYHDRLNFSFPPAFMKEAKIRIAAEWKPADMAGVMALLSAGKLDLSGLVTHREVARNADAAYRTAFSDRSCLKMILDWRGQS